MAGRRSAVPPWTTRDPDHEMRAVQHARYGAATEVLEVRTDAPLPTPRPDEIRVRVRATSVNPIDAAVRGGYGATYWESIGFVKHPHTPGRDVTGEVDAVGADVTAFQVGDVVWAGTLSGGSADYAVLPAAWAASKPKTLSYLEAGALPYVALTAWEALVKRAGLSATNSRGKRVVVPRGAGGVGSFAIQLLKAWGAEVATVCSTRNVELMRSLGADVIVDHTKQDFAEILRDYDVAFDTQPGGEERLMRTLRDTPGTAYVSIVSPKLRIIDQLGLENGVEAGNRLLAERQAQEAERGRIYDWSFMQPDGAALAEIGELVDAGKIRVIIDRVYPLEDLAQGHLYAETGSAVGKIVVNVAADGEGDGCATKATGVALGA